MAVTSDGATLYVAAFGSSKIGVFDTAALENDTFVPSGGEPHRGQRRRPERARARRGARPPLRAHALRQRDLGHRHRDRRARSRTSPLHNPEPASVVDGRPFLYDAAPTSSNGEASCASCHIFGDFDSLAWDLGNPDDVVLNNPNPIRVGDPLGTAFPTSTR